MQVLVTGATGFLGRRVIHALTREGATVLALARSAAARDAVTALGATPVPGDLDRPGGLVLPPADAVIHAAALFRLAGPRADFVRTNVAGTAALLAAARAAGVPRFVNVGAAAVVMDDGGAPVRGADETAPVNRGSRFAYLATKAGGEALVLAANAPGFTTLSVRPPGIWGPGDAFSAALPAMLRRKMFVFIGGGRFGWSTAHVDNVAEALCLALMRGAGGQAYFVNDREPVTFRAFAGGIAGAMGLSVAGTPSLPYGLASFAGGAMEAGARLVGAKGDPPISRMMVRMIGREFTTSDARARADLGYVGRVSRAEGLAGYAGGGKASGWT